MTEQEWLASTDAKAMLQLVVGVRADLPSDPGHSLSVYTFAPRASDRKLRLFACAIFRRNAAYNPGSFFRKEQEAFAEECEAWVDGGPRPHHSYYFVGIVDPVASAVYMADSSWSDHAYASSVLRCIFGNPFRPSILRCSRCDGDGIVYKLALHAYEAHAWDRLPILADALEEAGCDDVDVLAHLRGPGPHARGCWALDLVLGRE